MPAPQLSANMPIQEPTIFIYFAQQLHRNDLCSPSSTIGYKPKSLTVRSQDITKSQQLGGNQFDRGLQCGGWLDSHWLPAVGREDPYQWRWTSCWSGEIAVNSLWGARQISAEGDLRAAVSIQAVRTTCSLEKKVMWWAQAGVGVTLNKMQWRRTCFFSFPARVIYQ